MAVIESVLLIDRFAARAWSCALGIVLDEGLEQFSEGGSKQRAGAKRPSPPRKSRHPVAVFGRLAEWGEKIGNKGSARQRFWRGTCWSVVLLLFVFLLGALLGAIVQGEAGQGFWAVLLQGFLCAVLIAPAALDRCVALVEHALRAGDLPEARTRVSVIVGRQTSDLDEAATARAAIESLVENFCDATLAPLFWYMILGLPGLFLYKAANTLDSQFGYRSARYVDFGKFAARLDDGLSYVPARLSGLAIALSSGLTRGASLRGAFRALRDFAPSWRRWARSGFAGSPNAPHPEAAIAGALGIKLGGARRYVVAGETIVAGEWIGKGRAQCTFEDIAVARGALHIALSASLILFALLGVALGGLR